MTDTKASCHCENCGWKGLQEQTRTIAHLLSRVQPGELMPAGECPRCASLVHLAELPVQTLAAAASAMRQLGWVAVPNEMPHPLGFDVAHKSHPVFVRVTPCASGVKGPSWLRFTLGKEFIDRVSMLGTIADQAGLHTVTDYQSAEWEYDGSVLIMQTLLVTPQSCLWEAYIAGKNCRVESDPVDFHDLNSAAASTEDGEPIFIGITDHAIKEDCLESLEVFEQAAKMAAVAEA
jgi:hypothetical protein